LLVLGSGIARRYSRAAVLVFAVAFLSLRSSPATEPRNKVARENDLKAVFLFNFTQFVEWPAAAFSDPTEPFVIGVLGEDPFGKSLDDIVADETVKNRKIVIQRYHNVREITNCHILFISQSESARLGHIIESLNGKNILTVGETDGFSEAGGAIRFLVVQNKLHLRINLDSVHAAQLTISSKLLRQAEIIESKPGQ
jgi:YfiR/HmsC-like